MNKSILFHFLIVLVFSVGAKENESSQVKGESKTEKLVVNKQSSEVATGQKDTPRMLIDETKAMVHGTERSQLFCQSDLERRGIDSRVRTLEDLITDELTYQQAIRLKVPIEDAVVKDHLNRTLRGFGLKPGDEEVIFAQEGYSFEEGFEQFRVMYGVNIMVDHHIKSGLLVPDEAIMNKYAEKPIMQHPAYLLETAFIPVGISESVQEIQKKVDQFISTSKELEVTWSDPYWLKETEIGEGLDFIPQMKLDQIKSQKVVNGFQLYRLRKKRLQHTVSFDELVQLKEKKERYQKVYHDITEILRKELFETKMIAYKKSLLNEATVIYFNSAPAA